MDDTYPNLNSNQFFSQFYSYLPMRTGISQSVSLKMTHDFGGFGPFPVQTDNGITDAVYRPIIRHILQKSVLFSFVTVREEPLGTSGHLWKHKLSLSLSQTPHSWGQFSRRNSSPPSVSPSTLHPYQDPWNPWVLCLTLLNPQSTVLYIVFVPEVLE